ncbi:MAG: response regulator [Oscillospiraceae bacterium]|nr:response regulator [Oscillospiraceae bacterium]
MKRIIVTDDEPMNLKMTEFILKKNGYEVITAASGSECLNAVKENKADLILLDLLMPEMNGFETFEELRACEEGRDIPVILLTAAEDIETLEKADAMGIFACVRKPFKQPDLLSKIKLALNEE